MQIDFKKLWQAFVEKGLTAKKIGEMSKEEIEALCAVVMMCASNPLDDIPF